MIVPCCEINENCNAITWLFDTLPDGTSEGGYSQQIYALGVTEPALYNLVDGTLPSGLTLSESGLLSGTLEPSSEGTYDFTISVYDANKCYATKDYSLTINEQSGFYTWDDAPMVFGTSHLRWSDRWPI